MTMPFRHLPSDQKTARSQTTQASLINMVMNGLIRKKNVKRASAEMGRQHARNDVPSLTVRTSNILDTCGASAVQCVSTNRRNAWHTERATSSRSMET